MPVYQVEFDSFPFSFFLPHHPGPFIFRLCSLSFSAYISLSLPLSHALLPHNARLLSLHFLLTHHVTACGVTEEEKAQADRYKQLLLKQRDIMIALTQRLVERDEQIMALQDELDAYDRRHKELEEKLDEKTASLIK